LKDTDGDDVADVRYVYLQGIGSADTHHAANAFVYGPDGGIYWQSGIFLVNNIESPYGPSLNTGNSGMFRFDPRRFTINFHARNDPNPHGISFDKWGYHFANDGTGGRTWQVRPEGHGFKMYELLKMQVRPVAANGVISSANFPDEMQDDFILCNTIGFLGIKHYKLERNPDNGHVWGEPAEDLVSSTDKNFRPTDVEFGSDGALYFSDWQNVIIGHMQHNVRDPNRDHIHGRVYRMVNTKKPLQEPVKIAGASLDQLMVNLEHPVDGVRYRTRIELSGRDTDEVIAAANKWMKKLDPKKREDAHALLEGLWLHQQHNVRNPQLLASLLESPEPHARIAAQTVQHHLYHVNAKADAMVKAKVEAAEKPAEQPAVKSGVISDTGNITQVRIGTIVEKMKYDVAEFTVKAGKKLEITFSNPDFMPHNIVFVKPGTADTVGMAAMQLGTKGFELQFIPESNDIIAASDLVQNGKEQVLEFTAPTAPGDYQFVCTFPGHYILMRGVMKVR
jgi:azurin